MTTDSVNQFQIVPATVFGLLPIECQRSECVVLFGSSAAGIAAADSDLDVLCVGTGPRVKTARLDILWMDRKRVESHEWLGSELAVHIGAFGRCLRGSACWMKHAFVSQSAIDRKSAAVQRRVAAFRHFGPQLEDHRLSSYARRVRRDVQRLELLRQAMPVPATPLLDRLWTRSGNWEGLVGVLESLGLVPCNSLLRGLRLDAH